MAFHVVDLLKKCEFSLYPTNMEHTWPTPRREMALCTRRME